MNKRLTLAFIFAFFPVVALGLIFPQRALDGRTPEGEAVYVSAEGADIVAFVSESCPHCREFKEYAQREGWAVNYYDITALESQQLFSALQKRAPSLQQAVPTIILNGQVIQGYDRDDTTGSILALKRTQCQESTEGCLPFEEFLASERTVSVQSAEGICIEGCEVDLDQFLFDLPFLGEVDLTLLSLPTLSILLGFLDGFNPCAMWVLITLLTLLIATRDPKKIWLVGGTFLFVSGAMYYLFIAAWLNAFLLIGFNLWVQKVIGIVAIGGGAFYFYEALGKDPNQCQVTNLQQRQRLIEKMKSVLMRTAWPAMLLGVAILAFSVNLIELVCTAGLPAIFTQILAFNQVSNAARYGYMLLYILLYMIDDLIIFTIAVYTLHATGLTKKYARFTLIFGGFLMYALGVLLIFAPEVLTFA
ncbi:hypothetical protein COU80_02495 [Candidatus Peregrinibacteria bacterium CG10_big_fil_rev_8_21_14_0_10_55_24]|nr:MAG: hypothetical protein COU80_02495 [Candidatus Peregrinibacteria bacterium CG10_big_fil_rev_8_21_14_0_10_55_24]